MRKNQAAMGSSFTPLGASARAELTAVMTPAMGAEMSAVFVGLTPFTSGMLLFVPTRDLVELDMGVDDAAKLIVSGGLVYPIPKEKERH